MSQADARIALTMTIMQAMQNSSDDSASGEGNAAVVQDRSEAMAPTARTSCKEVAPPARAPFGREPKARAATTAPHVPRDTSWLITVAEGDTLNASDTGMTIARPNQRGNAKWVEAARGDKAAEGVIHQSFAPWQSQLFGPRSVQRRAGRPGRSLESVGRQVSRNVASGIEHSNPLAAGHHRQEASFGHVDSCVGEDTL